MSMATSPCSEREDETHSCRVLIASFASDELRRAWTLLHEYHDFHRLAQHRNKLEQQAGEKRIPWKSMVTAVLSQSPSISERQGEADERPSQNNVEMFFAK